MWKRKKRKLLKFRKYRCRRLKKPRELNLKWEEKKRPRKFPKKLKPSGNRSKPKNRRPGRAWLRTREQFRKSQNMKKKWKNWSKWRSKKARSTRSKSRGTWTKESLPARRITIPSMKSTTVFWKRVFENNLFRKD